MTKTAWRLTDKTLIACNVKLKEAQHEINEALKQWKGIPQQARKTRDEAIVKSRISKALKRVRVEVAALLDAEALTYAKHVNDLGFSDLINK